MNFPVTACLATSLLTTVIAVVEAEESYPVYLLSQETPEAIRTIEFAIHPWLSYLSTDVHYAGTKWTDKWNDITIGINTLEEVYAVTKNIETAAYTSRSIFLDSGLFAKAKIVINSAYFTSWGSTCTSQLLVHEFGHVFGINNHSTNPSSTLHATQINCNAIVTLADVALLRSPVYSACKSQLTKEGNLFIPYFNGKEVYLERVEEYVWKISYMNDVVGVSPIGNCATLKPNLDFTVYHVSSPEYEISAEFVFIGNDHWKLIKVIDL